MGGVKGVDVVGRKGAGLLGQLRGRAGPLGHPDLLQHCKDGPLILQSTTMLSDHVLTLQDPGRQSIILRMPLYGAIAPASSAAL